jgi:hypothetical protein
VTNTSGRCVEWWCANSRAAVLALPQVMFHAIPIVAPGTAVEPFPIDPRIVVMILAATRTLPASEGALTTVRRSSESWPLQRSCNRRRAVDAMSVDTTLTLRDSAHRC